MEQLETIEHRNVQKKTERKVITNFILIFYFIYIDIFKCYRKFACTIFTLCMLHSSSQRLRFGEFLFDIVHFIN